MSEKQRQEYNLNIVAGLTCVAEIVYYCYVIYVFGINTSVPTRVGICQRFEKVDKEIMFVGVLPSLRCYQ